MRAFEGKMDILSKPREVSYMDAAMSDGNEVEKSVLSITGLTLAEVWAVLSALSAHSGVDAPKGANGTSKEPAKLASVPAVTPTKPVTPTAPPKPAPPPKVVVKAPDPEPSEDEEPDADLDDLGEESGDLDVEHMAKQEKLRPVIEHMIEKGFNTPEKILNAARNLIETVPMIKQVNDKGGFDKRIEKAAMVVLGHDGSS